MTQLTGLDSLGVPLVPHAEPQSSGNLQEARDELLQLLADWASEHMDKGGGFAAPIRRAIFRLQDELFAERRLRETLAKADGGR